MSCLDLLIDFRCETHVTIHSACNIGCGMWRGLLPPSVFRQGIPCRSKFTAWLILVLKALTAFLRVVTIKCSQKFDKVGFDLIHHVSIHFSKGKSVRESLRNRLNALMRQSPILEDDSV